MIHEGYKLKNNLRKAPLAGRFSNIRRRFYSSACIFRAFTLHIFSRSKVRV
jgi:hypothetical protein